MTTELETRPLHPARVEPASADAETHPWRPAPIPPVGVALVAGAFLRLWQINAVGFNLDRISSSVSGGSFLKSSVVGGRRVGQQRAPARTGYQGRALRGRAAPRAASGPGYGA